MKIGRLAIASGQFGLGDLEPRPSPILGEVAEHAIRDLVPFAGPRWEVATMDGHPQTHRQHVPWQPLPI